MIAWRTRLCDCIASKNSPILHLSHRPPFSRSLISFLTSSSSKILLHRSTGLRLFHNFIFSFGSSSKYLHLVLNLWLSSILIIFRFFFISIVFYNVNLQNTIYIELSHILLYLPTIIHILKSK